MTGKATQKKVPSARTLKEAHEVLSRLRPKNGAPLPEWLTFRRTSAALYTEIADVDRFHHHEALYWAEREQEEVNTLASQIATSEK
ncbi:MAG: AMED_5909 family protein [Gammaproteobacteria bacterium]